MLFRSFNSADTLEVYAGITVAASEKVSLGAKYSISTTDLFGYANSDGSGYLDLTANFAVAEGWTINTHAGKQWIEGNDAFEYTDWKLGLTKDFGQGLAISVAYIDTNADRAVYTNSRGRYMGRATGLLSLTKTF